MPIFYFAPLFSYDKSKNLLLKGILPFLIIVHHTMQSFNLSMNTLFGDPVMFVFFAMSGYGLVSSYQNRKDYLNGFLKRQLLKLFVPYLSAFILIVIFKYCQGISLIEYFSSTPFLSIVPFSWFIFCLSLFYVFFYFVFKYVKGSNLTKVLTVCVLVLAYILVLRELSWASWLYNRCFPFCVGMFFALYDSKIRSVFVQWQVLTLLALNVLIVIALGLLFYVLRFSFPFSTCFFSIFVGIALFLFLYSIPPISESRIIRFFSSISLEMYILQYIAIALIVQVIGINSFILALPFIFLIDILIAYPIHKFNSTVISKLLPTRPKQ